MDSDDINAQVLCLDGWYLTNYNNPTATAIGDWVNIGGSDVSTADKSVGMECKGNNSLRLYIPDTSRMSI